MIGRIAMMPFAIIPGPTELILILVIVIVVFGAKRIPEIMGGLGEGIKTFKKAMEGEGTTPTPPPQIAAPPTSAPTQANAQNAQAPATTEEKADSK
jgi:sec-independent protein translocase protein TatA